MAAKKTEQRGEKGGAAPSPAPASASSGVKLGPALTLASAGAVKEALQAALAGQGPINLDASAVDEVDLAGLQLICATHRVAARDGRELDLAGGARCAALVAAVGALGFGRDVGCGDRCLCREVAHG
jgi:anti-anti-sigma regulatory factor